MAATLDEILNSHRTRRPIIAGILNVTPDSFSDGGRFLAPAAAVARAAHIVKAGADMIDVGAESTRPGAERVPAAEQIDRLRDVLPALRGCGAVVSIDTTSAEVAAFAIESGTAVINDVSAGREDPDLLPLAASAGAAIILMHMLGEPRTMQADPRYANVVTEVKEFLRRRMEAAVAAGVDPGRIILDPGLGFGKRIQHNLALLKDLEELSDFGRPVMLGPSRKRFIGELTAQTDPARRAAGTIGACLEGWRRGATLFRVHDVGEVVSAFAVVRAIAGR